LIKRLGEGGSPGWISTSSALLSTITPTRRSALATPGADPTAQM
jgi:hypothetical protein